MFRDRSKAWLPISSRRSQDISDVSPVPKGFSGRRPTSTDSQRNWGLTIDLPPPPSAPFTMAQSRTPGWDSPWSPRAARNGHPPTQELFGYDDDSQEKVLTRKKKFRTFILKNTYVPLVGLMLYLHLQLHLICRFQLFRFINIVFTSAALGVATRIRLIEKHNHVMGAVGSSPYVLFYFYRSCVYQLIMQDTCNHICPIDPRPCHGCHLPRIFWPTPRPLEYLKQTHSHSFGSLIYLRLVRRPFPMLRQLLHLPRSLCRVVVHLMVQSAPATLESFRGSGAPRRWRRRPDLR